MGSVHAPSRWRGREVDRAQPRPANDNIRFVGTRALKASEAWRASQFARAVHFFASLFAVAFFVTVVINLLLRLA